MSGVKCGTCANDLKARDKILQCKGLCEKFYHLSCAKLKDEEFKVISSNVRIMWYCDNCHLQLHFQWKRWLVELEENLKLAAREQWELLKKINGSVEEILINKQQSGSNNDGTKSTYAMALKSKNESIVLIKPKNEQNSTLTRTDLKKKVDPTTMAVSGLRNAAKGGIIVECQNKDATSKIEKELKTKLGRDYEVKVPEPRRPRIKIIGMSEKLDNQELLDKIRAQNDAIEEKSDLKVLYTGKMGTRNKFFSIIETDGKTFLKIMKDEKLNVGWDRCKVAEAFRLIRCFKCCGFNHMASECTKEQVCPKCGKNHTQDKCDAEQLECVNCKYTCEKLKIKISFDHAAYDPECPVFKRKLDLERSKTDYKS